MTGRGQEVVVVRTGTANLASIVAGLRRVGAEPLVTEERDVVERAERLVLPGVGTVAAAMARLKECELIDPLVERLRDGRPTLTVCLGLQLMCRESEESPGEPGLGVIRAQVTRFPSIVRVPQLGWNEITPSDELGVLRKGYVYFANSYRLRTAPPGWKVASSDYGGPFVAAMERGAVLACQFHPELSGRFGLELMARWLDGSNRMKEEPC